MSHIDIVLEQLASKASSVIIPILNKAFGRDYAKQCRVKQDDNIISVYFPVDHAARGAYLSVGGKPTASGQALDKSKALGEENATELQKIMVDMYDKEMEDHWVDGPIFGFVAAGKGGTFY